MNNVYSVKQLNAYIRNMFTQDFLLTRVTVRGEISNLKDHPSGHIYFTLKDGDSQISGVMFRGARRGLKCSLREGLLVEVTGQVSVYDAAGRYQIYAGEIKEAGEGDLYKKFLELKKRLEEMGMFDAAFKKPIPKYALKIGVVTASSGAALQDIINVTKRRNPYVQLILSPALVQGEGAPSSIIKAIERLDRIRPDVMIVGRGGGSAEDLWAFNDEGVAKAIFNADTPVISAVGHEVDFTIADFVSDLRAPTPSAAAELAVFDVREYKKGLEDAKTRMEKDVRGILSKYRADTEKLNLKLNLLHPRNMLKDRRMRLLDAGERLENAVKEILRQRQIRLSILAERLEGRSPLSKLTGGYGYITDNGKALKSAADAKSGDLLKITLSDGSVEGKVV